MNIPGKVKIGGCDYTVLPDKTMARDEDTLGKSCANALMIVIDDTAPKQQQETTFLHEIIEQINFQHQLELEHHKIKTLESALYQVLKDNKLNFSD